MLVFLFVEFLQGVDLFRGCAPQLDNLILVFLCRLVTDYPLSDLPWPMFSGP
jgi:hypothetical protein